jgi:hypothetical protein
MLTGLIVNAQVKSRILAVISRIVLLGARNKSSQAKLPLMRIAAPDRRSPESAAGLYGSSLM